eukprot:3545038-Rhodomonas_salina.6
MSWRHYGTDIAYAIGASRACAIGALRYWHIECDDRAYAIEESGLVDVARRMANFSTLQAKPKLCRRNQRRTPELWTRIAVLVLDATGCLFPVARQSVPDTGSADAVYRATILLVLIFSRCCHPARTDALYCHQSSTTTGGCSYCHSIWCYQKISYSGTDIRYGATRTLLQRAASRQFFEGIAKAMGGGVAAARARAGFESFEVLA